MRWECQIRGEARILAQLAEIFRGPERHVYERDGSFYLSSSDWNDEGDVTSVQDSAIRLAEDLSGAMALRCSAQKSITVGPVSPYDEPGAGRKLARVTFSIQSQIRVEPSVLRANGSLDFTPSTELVVSDLEIARRDPEMDWALRLLNGPDRSFGPLYKIFELISERARNANAKNEHAKPVYKRHKTQLDKVKASANNLVVSGELGRHGVQEGSAPNRTNWLTIDEARQIIAHALRDWFDMERAADLRTPSPALPDDTDRS